jgi:hypothetical protein
MVKSLDGDGEERMHPVAYAQYAAQPRRPKPVKKEKNPVKNPRGRPVGGRQKEKNPVKNPRGRPVGGRQNPIAVQVRLASSAHGGEPSAFQLT